MKIYMNTQRYPRDESYIRRIVGKDIWIKRDIGNIRSIYIKPESIVDNIYVRYRWLHASEIDYLFAGTSTDPHAHAINVRRALVYRSPVQELITNITLSSPKVTYTQEEIEELINGAIEE